MDEFPEWAQRQVLAQALEATGLPWVPSAWYCRPRDNMKYGQTLQAIALVGRVLQEARLRLPPGACGTMLDRAWRDRAWRCVVAGMGLLDAEAREQFTIRDDAQRARPVAAESPPKPAKPAAVTAPVRFRIYREGEVPREP